MARRHLTVTLPREEYLLLGELATREERTAPQQASYLLRQLLRDTAAGPGREAQGEEPRRS